MSTLAQDLRFGFRLLRKNPWLTVVAVLALGMGIGLTAMMYSIIYGMLLRGLPFEGADRIYHAHRSDASQGITQMGVPLHDFLDWREQQRAFEELAAFYSSTVSIGDTGHAERFSGGFMTANAFRILGVQPLLGRALRDGDDAPGAAPVIILSHDAWQSRYNADPGVVGREVRVNGRTAEIVGVMPQGFRFPTSQQVWVPLELDPTRFGRGEGTLLEVYGRLRPGVAPSAAKAEFDAITERIEAAHPSGMPNVQAQVMPYTERFVGEGPRKFLSTMLGAVFLVLLIACANVANLLLTRAALRSKEVGIRTALGAPRSRVVTQFLAESLALATVGAALGLLIAWSGVRLFNAAIEPTNPPFWFDIRLDAPVLLFAAGVTMLAALVAGALPAWQASRADRERHPEGRGPGILQLPDGPARQGAGHHRGRALLRAAGRRWPHDPKRHEPAHPRSRDPHGKRVHRAGVAARNRVRRRRFPDPFLREPARAPRRAARGRGGFPDLPPAGPRRTESPGRRGGRELRRPAA